MDPFSVLGLDKSADLEEIRRAYLRLAELHHPDRGGDPKRFKLIREAYEQLLRRPPPPPPPPKDTVTSATPHLRFESRPLNKKIRRRRNSPLAVVCWSVSLIAIVILSIYLISSIDFTSDRPVAQSPASKGHVQESEALPDPKKRPDSNTEAVVNPDTTSEISQGEMAQMESIVPTRNEKEGVSNSIDNEESSYSTETVRQREPLPTVADQQNPRRTVANLFKARYAAANTRDSKIELASKIFEAARDEEDFVTKYVLFEIAKDIAIQNIDINLALSSAEQIERIFDVETGSILNSTVSDLSATLAKEDSIDRELADESFFFLVMFANKSIVEGNVSQANEWLVQARHVAKMVMRTGLETRIGTLLDAVREEAINQSELANAVKMLAIEPENSDANLLVGKDLCLRGEWKEGFSRLRLSSESEIKRLADIELETGSDAESQEKLADLWWDYTSEDPKLAKLAKGRARHHYLAAIVSAKGLAKLKIESRLSQLSTDPILHNRDEVLGKNREPNTDLTREKSQPTKVLLEEFITRHDSSLKEIKQLDTRLQRQAAQEKFEEKMNKSLRGQIWTVRFPIMDIAKSSRPGLYSVSLGVPIDMPTAFLSYQFNAVVELSGSRASQITHGAYAFEIVGRPFYSRENNPSYLVDLGSIGGGRIQLTNAKSRVISLTKNIEPGVDEENALGSQRPHDGIVLENGPVTFIPFFQSSNLPVNRDKADTHLHYRVEYKDDKAIVSIHNAVPTVVNLEIELSQGAGSRLVRPGLDLSRLSEISSIPTVIVTWANSLITSVTWDEKAVPPLEEVDVEEDLIEEQVTYELPPISLDAKLYHKAHQIIETQIEWAKKNKAPEGYVILGNEFMDGHDCSALLPLSIVYGPIFTRRDNSLVLVGETASVVFDAGVGADGKERIVVTQLKHAIGQSWEGDPIPTREEIQATTYVTERNGMKSGRFLKNQ
jgi:hypothetical protein